MDSTLLTQLVCTRISHDLSGAIGAVYNGTELLAEDVSFASEASALIQSSAETLMCRMRFFRQTFGLPSAAAEDTTPEYLKTFSMPFEIKGKCTHAWQRALLISLTDLYYRGGIFNISGNKIEATGSALKDARTLQQILKTGVGDETAANAPAFFAFEQARQLKTQFSMTIKENKIEISL